MIAKTCKCKFIRRNKKVIQNLATSTEVATISCVCTYTLYMYIATVHTYAL